MGNIIKQQDKRRAFVETLNNLNDPKIIVIIPDVGFLYLDSPDNKFKVLNLGVTEASAMMIATALALEGFKVFYYSMINFSLFRPGEMVRNGLVCHNAPVTLIGVKGSDGYKFLGFSHNLLHDDEDIEFCENIGLKWYRPVDNEDVKISTKECYNSNKPNYMRL